MCAMLPAAGGFFPVPSAKLGLSLSLHSTLQGGPHHAALRPRSVCPCFLEWLVVPGETFEGTKHVEPISQDK